MRGQALIVTIAAGLCCGVASGADMRLLGELTMEFERQLYERNVEVYTRLLRRTGLNPTEADRMIHDTALAEAKCTVSGFREQAEAQGIAVDSVYAALLGQLRGDSDASALEGLDEAGVNERLRRCDSIWQAMMQGRPGVLAYTKLNTSGPVSIGDTGITLVPPLGLKHDGSTSPFILRSDDASTSMTLTVKNKDVSTVDIVKLKDSFRRVIGKSVPQAEWHQDGIMELEGRQWILLEMSSRAPGFDLHKLFLASGYRDRLLICEVDATEDGFRRFQGPIWASVLSINLPDSME